MRNAALTAVVAIGFARSTSLAISRSISARSSGVSFPSSAGGEIRAVNSSVKVAAMASRCSRSASVVSTASSKPTPIACSSCPWARSVGLRTRRVPSSRASKKPVACERSRSSGVT